MRDEEEFLQVSTRRDDPFAETGQVVLVGFSDAANDAMNSEPFKTSRNPARILVGETAVNILAAQSADEMLASGDGEK